MSAADFVVFAVLGVLGGWALAGVIYLATRLSRNPVIRCILAILTLALCYLTLSITLRSL